MTNNEDRLLIIYRPNGYSIICGDGTPMSFVDKTDTDGIADLKDAISICTDHGYKFEII